MGMKTLMPGACCDRRRCVGYALAAFAAIYCAWMAALGFNWEGITDGTLPACLPATASVLGLCLLATCPPPSVLGIIISLAVLGWKFQALRGAVWVSLWAAGSLSSTFTCCQLFADAPQPVEVKDEEAGAVAVGGFKEDVESARQPLRVLIRLVAYVMHLPSSVLMNLLWTIPCVVTALPRCLAVLYFELVDTVLVTVGGLLLTLGKRCSLASNLHILSSHHPTTRTPVILVTASGGEAHWIVPRLNFLRKSELYGPVLVFESEGGPRVGIKEAAEELRDFILSSEVLEPSNQSVVLVGHSVGGLICAYFSDMLASESRVQVGSVVCLSTPWAGFKDPAGVKGLVPRVLATGAHWWLRAQKFSGKMREDLQAGSQVLMEVQDWQLLPPSSHKLSRPRFYNLAGSLDIVMAGESRQIAGRNAFWCCFLPHVGHGSILLSRTVWEQVFVWLDSAQSTSRRKAGALTGNGSAAPSAGDSEHQTAASSRQHVASSYGYAQARAVDCVHAGVQQDHVKARTHVHMDACHGLSATAGASCGEGVGSMAPVPHTGASEGHNACLACNDATACSHTIAHGKVPGPDGGSLRCKMSANGMVSGDIGRGPGAAREEGSPSKGPLASKKRPPPLAGSQGFWGAGTREGAADVSA